MFLQGLKSYSPRHGALAGIPSYRTRVMYVPQRPSLLPGSPTDFVKAIMNLHSHKILIKDDIDLEETTQQVMKRCSETAQRWGIGPDLWNRDWINLSGGEGQRILLSIAASLNTAEILLLDGKFYFHCPPSYQSSRMGIDRTDICVRLGNVSNGGKFPSGPCPHTQIFAQSHCLDHPLRRTKSKGRKQIYILVCRWLPRRR